MSLKLHDYDRILACQNALKFILASAEDDDLDEEALRERGLESVVEITQSEGGYLHFFHENENLIDLAKWSDSVRKICKSDTAMHYPVEFAGIWADCVRNRAPVVHNDYAAIPDAEKGGLPSDHFPVHRHMSVPVIKHGKIVAIAGVGNKTLPYDDIDVEQAQLFMDSLWSVLTQKSAEEVLRRYAYEDGLTGLTNRRRFQEVLSSEWKRARRSGNHLSLILLDVDYFKQFNDFYGHTQGDGCLVQVAEVLSRSFRRTGEVVARFGGDEFVVLLPYTDAVLAHEHAKIALQNVNALGLRHAKSKVTDHVTISLGVASCIPDHEDPQKFVDEADRNLYLAKTSGRNRVVCSQ